MIRFLTLALILALLPLSAGNAQDVNPSAKEEKDKRQIDWVGDWDSAFKQAKEGDRIVMLCINSKDGESANERAASKTYKDEDFVALTRKFVMVVVSTRDHAGMFGTCKRFGGVTCTQHVDCYKYLRNKHGDQFLIEGGEMISPQHAFFAGDGRLLWRKEYELTKAPLVKGRLRPQPLPGEDRERPLVVLGHVGTRRRREEGAALIIDEIDEPQAKGAGDHGADEPERRPRPACVAASFGSGDSHLFRLSYHTYCAAGVSPER